ncbi:hypothetical protein O3M35_002843 [Rhynocoris fuscipes]|uniref:Uncharacterized protein n=1 Tax=Rhynocoris fuscipes TaxID=488301 RepID=A0AAW1CQW3_9HEMI
MQFFALIRRPPNFSYSCTLPSNKTLCKFFFFLNIFSDFPQLPVELIEKIVDYDSTDLELYLINIYAKQRPNMLPWNDVNRKHWLKWCSLSSNLFYEFICILNELLIRTRKQRMIDITRNFAENLLKLCNENDIDYVALYPLRLQHLVSFMIINFEPLENSSISKLLKETFKSEFIRLRDENPAAALVIATHFAKCGTYIE